MWYRGEYYSPTGAAVTMEQTPGIFLVVDDEQSVRWVLAKALEQVGHTVVQADHGSEAVRQLVNGDVEVAFVDLRMPDLDGLAVLAKAHGAGIRTPIIIVTAQNTMDNAIEAMKRGAYDYITKPFSLDEVRATAARAKCRAGQSTSSGWRRSCADNSNWALRSWARAHRCRRFTRRSVAWHRLAPPY